MSARRTVRWTVRGLLCDLDGTLVTSIDATETAWRAWATRLGIAGFDHVQYHGMPAADIVRKVVSPARELEAMRLISQLEEEHVGGISARSGAADLIASLSHTPWAIVTSGTQSLAQRRLTIAGLPMPEVMVTADRVTHGKPDPEGFLLAAALLHLDPAATLAIEDSPAGLAAARRAGCRTVGLTGTYPSSALMADVLVDDLRDVRVVGTEAGGTRVEIDPLPAPSGPE